MATHTNKLPLTDSHLLSLGFQRLDNGQYELVQDRQIVMCFFNGEGSVTVKAMQTEFPLHPVHGYHQRTIAPSVDCANQLATLLENQ
ncbi:MAG: hypothetical protein KDE52_13455 [Calditrichaeota bacterium]|nr:hypothetical protein [Calditrichota bacterium]MCB0268448.1 hypothetical protein [Calditrichota bacterium]MCB0301056.1 hypothetical protein [Calditrichota bacterium]MCB9069842.1 hypothetical protein [Calditrichia bacterium]